VCGRGGGGVWGAPLPAPGRAGWMGQQGHQGGEGRMGVALGGHRHWCGQA
jgi:hypothetical protein